MFSLIITIISIALVAALALATLYFGGDAFNEGSAKAAAATVVNQASQINGANTLHYLEEQEYSVVGTDTNLVDNGYLSSMPNAGDTATGTYAVQSVTDSTISLDGVKAAVCDAVNGQSGATQLTAQADVATAAGAMTTQFGCHLIGVSGSEVKTFIFK